MEALLGWRDADPPLCSGLLAAMPDKVKEARFFLPNRIGNSKSIIELHRTQCQNTVNTVTDTTHTPSRAQAQPGAQRSLSLTTHTLKEFLHTQYAPPISRVFLAGNGMHQILTLK